MIKRFFITPYALGLFLTSIHSLVMLAIAGLNTAWLAAAVAVVPGGLFFGRIMLGHTARTTNHTPLLWGPAALGVVLLLAMPSAGWIPVVYVLGWGLFGSLAYDFWYSRLGERSSPALVVGKQLPDFTLYSANGEEVKSATIRQAPALLMFYRGNWCPLCMAQIKEVAAQYRELSDRGVGIYLISNQSETFTQDLAKKFDVPMNFMVDRDATVAKRLGIAHQNGTPAGLAGYESETTMPTVVISNEGGEIIFADLTDNYRVRPEPETFLAVLDGRLPAES